MSILALGIYYFQWNHPENLHTKLAPKSTVGAVESEVVVLRETVVVSFFPLGDDVAAVAVHFFGGLGVAFVFFFTDFLGVDFDICLVPSPMIDFDSNDYAGWNRKQQQKNYFFNFTVDVMHYEHHILV